MEVVRITPQGYCKGVVNALKIVNVALDDKNTKRPIYLLGQVIHNKIVMKELISKGAIILDDKSKTREELIDGVNEGTIIFSAHGVSDLVREKALSKKLNIIDATCPKVLDVHDIVKKKIDEGYDVLYIGTKGHPECEGILGISTNIYLITNINDVDNIKSINKKIYVTNQTTLSKYDLFEIIDKIKSRFIDVETDNKICNATTIRQEALARQKNFDLCIIVGDSASSNTRKLAYVSEKIALIKTIMIESVADIKPEMLANVKRVSVSSGASTPKKITDEVIEYLKKI